MLLLFLVLTSVPLRNAGADVDSARALRERASELCRQGKFEAAVRDAERAVELDQQQHGTQHPDAAASLNVLSEAYLGLGQYTRALELANRALAIRETVRGPEHLETAESLNDVGVLYLYLKQPERAADPINRALAIRKRLLPAEDLAVAESESNRAAVFASRAVALEAKGDREDAIENLADAVKGFERALQIKEAALGPGDPSACATRSNLTATYLRLAGLEAGDDQARLHEKAQQLAVRAKLCAQDSSDGDQGLGEATAQINQGWALWKQNVALNRRSIVVLDQMRDLFKSALATREQVLGPEHPDTAQGRVMLATTAQALGDYRQALDLLQRALATEDRMLATFVAAGDEQQRLALLQEAQGHYWAALSLIQRRLAKDADAVRLGLELVLRRKGIILDVQTRLRDAVSKRFDEATADAWRRLIDRQAELSRFLVQGPGDDPAGYRRRVDALRAEIEQEERRLGEKNLVFAEELAQRNVGAAAVAAQLPKDAVLVEYVRIRDWDDQGLQWLGTQRYLAFVLTPDNEVSLVDLGEAGPIDKALREAFSAIEDPRAFTDAAANQQKTDAALGKLYTVLVEPLGSTVTKYEHWILSPDGEINKTPFPALRTPAGRYVVEDRLVSLVSSGRDLLRAPPTRKPELAMLMVANPRFDSTAAAKASSSRRRRRGDAGSRGRFRYQFGPLPGTADEAKAIRPLVQGRAEFLEDDAATEPAVWDIVLDRPPRILHFATHGLFEGAVPMEPVSPGDRASGSVSAGRRDDLLLRSFLALAGVNQVREVLPSADDGVLYAAEVAEMDLYGTELVVLSACQTALGDVQTGEGVYGLRRAFVLAGARNLVMSLWPVDDDETRHLMEHFYRAYSEGMPASRALREAQLRTLRALRQANEAGGGGQPVAQVVLWAPFVVQQGGL